MKSNDQGLRIGRSDIADFPELGFFRLAVKTDTGAYTSSIHCHQVYETKSGELEVIFLDPEHPSYSGQVHRFEKFVSKNVKSSNATVERRYVVQTDIEFPGLKFGIELSLTDRIDMRFPVLLGRKFLSANHFIVYPKRRNLLYKRNFRTSRHE